MTRWYSTIPLSLREQREYEQVLLDELDIQVWFTISWCTSMETEAVLCTQ
jgi:hypothetical protein